MGLLADCERIFGSTDIYKLLDVPKDASPTAIKKAYRRLSLLMHPDRVNAVLKQAATQKFQVLSKVYVVLSDSEKRAVYDETGCVDDDEDLSDNKDWDAYWRLIFPNITTADIDKFMLTYKGSPEETEDLKKHYEEHEGDFDAISECLIGYQFDEEDRYREILNDLIAKEEIEAYPKFTKEPKKKRNARRDRFLAEAKEVTDSGGMEDLAMAISKRQRAREESFNSLIDNIEARYCKPKKKKVTK
ncbi:unnamed protein product [Ixodes pacificus]